MNSKLQQIASSYQYTLERQIDVFGQTVKIPVVYPDARAVMFFLPASFQKMTQTLASNRIKPVRLIEKKSFVAVTLFDYLKSDIGPFREFTISVPVLVDSKLNPPLLPLIFGEFFQRFGFYLLMLGTSSDISRQHIKEIFPYPLYPNNIEVEIHQKNKDLSASLLERGQEILNLNIRDSLPNSYPLKKKTYRTYYQKDGNLFCVRLDTFSQLTQSLQRNNASVRFKSHQLSDYVQDICFSTKPFGYIYYRNVVEIASSPQPI